MLMMQRMDAKMEANARDVQGIKNEMKTNAQEIKAYMQAMENKMDANVHDMQTQRGEMQSMGLSLL